MQKSQSPASKQQSSRSLFSRYGGRMTLNQINQLLNRTTMRPYEREYIKRTIERYHNPLSPHITEQEMRQSLQEMTQNTKDPVQLDLVKKLKKTFGL